jgi:hypothetical protein
MSGLLFPAFLGTGLVLIVMGLINSTEPTPWFVFIGIFLCLIFHNPATFFRRVLIIPIRISNCLLRKHQLFLGKASLRSNGIPLSSSENEVQNQLVLSQRARFKAAYSALHKFERAPLLLHSCALIKLL